MGLEKLVERGSVYGFGAGAVTAGVVVLVASLFDVVLPVVLLVLIAIAGLALVLLVGAAGTGPGPSGEEMDSNAGEIANPVEGSVSMNHAGTGAIVPATQLEYILYFSGFGTAAVGMLAVLLG
jgi:hypothetical protein